jgi:Tfp pilus assembly protein PilZ
VVEAALGAHSATNFYKGLSGNDVIDDGGVFIATYRIPRIGQEIWLRVSMPGGYEFDARAEVKWTREGGTSDAPPGFGAQFREISQEGRQLVYRYVRNREPLFHDDF